MRRPIGNPRTSIGDSSCTSVTLRGAYRVGVRPPASADRCLKTVCSLKKCNDDLGTVGKGAESCNGEFE